jgi:hypothetical protein
MSVADRSAVMPADRARCAAAMRSMQELGLLGEMTDAVDRAEYAGG